MKTLEQIEEQFSQLKKEIEEFKHMSKPKVDESQLEVGKWYKLTKDYCVLKKGEVYPFKKYQGSCKIYANVNHDIFSNKPNGSYLGPRSSTLIPATDKEVKDVLVKEAKKRGFKKSVRYKCDDYFWGSSYGGNIGGNIGDNIINSNTITYKENKLWIDGLCIFKRGKWAEILEEEHPVPILHGYKMEEISYGCGIKFGCVTSNKEKVKRLYNTIRDFNIAASGELVSFRIREDGTDHEVDVSQLKEVVEYLNK